MDKRLMAEARQAKVAFALTALMSLISGVIIIAQAFLISRIINTIFILGESLEAVTQYLIGLAVLAVVRSLLGMAEHYFASLIAIFVKNNMRSRLLNHIMRLGSSQIQGERSGELALAATQGIEQMTAYFRDYLPALFTVAVIPLMILLVVFPVDWLTFVVLIVTAPLIPIFMILIGMMAKEVAEKQYFAMGRMSAHFLDVLEGLVTLKLFNRSRLQLKTIERVTENFRETTMRVLRIAFLSAFTLELLATLSIAVVAVEIGLRLIAGNMQFEQALFLLVLAPEFYLPLRALGVKYHASTDGIAAANRIFDVLDMPLPYEPENPASVPTLGTLEFKNVTFTYPDVPKPALSHINLQIPYGQRTVIVGASGSGKSTLANVLMRYRIPDMGTVSVNGVDLNRLQGDAWRKKIAYVSQSPYLFHQSVADNIRFACPDASLEQIREVARQANAHDFIMELPQGYDTIVGERGARLSGGQAQRIAIARALLKDAPIVVFDEATAHLDAQTEQLIHDALHQLMIGRTVIMIAHRLNTVTFADHVVVMSDGRIVEQGTHQALLSQLGIFSELMQAYRSDVYA